MSRTRADFHGEMPSVQSGGYRKVVSGRVMRWKFFANVARGWKGAADGRDLDKLQKRDDLTSGS